MPARLRETEGANVGAVYEIRDICVLGRALECQVHIRDLTVSRRHARIMQVDGKYILEDLGSGNGTFLNDEAVTRRYLNDRDVIRVSSACFVFEESERKTDSVTMVGAKQSPPRIVTTVDASQSLLNTASPITEASSPKELVQMASRLKTVYAVAAAISSILDLDELLPEILNRAFEVFPRAERGFIMLRDESGNRLIPKAVKRRNEGDMAEMLVSRTIIQQVLSKKQAVLSHDASEDHRFKTGRSVANYGIRAMMAAPLVWRQESLGIIYLDSPGIAAFNQADLELLSGIAQQGAAALGNARLHTELMKRQRLERDLHLAERIQQSFLPRRIPKVEGYTFCARYDSAHEVGGDFYDFVKLQDDKLGVVVGDVSGKGVSAALYMARLTRDLRYFALAESSPSKVLERLNQTVVEGGQDDIFVTLVYAVLDGAHRRLTYANAGHMPPILRRFESGQVLTFEEGVGLPLGVVADTEYVNGELELAPGDSVLMYTDGLVEAMDPKRNMYGVERLLEVVSQEASQADALLDRAVKDCMRHVQDAPQFDDTTVVCIGLDHPDQPMRPSVPTPPLSAGRTP